jgi:hypothetical protein
MTVEPKRSAQIKTMNLARFLAKAKIERASAAMQIRQGDVVL